MGFAQLKSRVLGLKIVEQNFQKDPAQLLYKDVLPRIARNLRNQTLSRKENLEDFQIPCLPKEATKNRTLHETVVLQDPDSTPDPNV